MRGWYITVVLVTQLKRKVYHTVVGGHRDRSKGGNVKKSSWHRVHRLAMTIFWRTMRVKSAQAGDSGGYKPTPFHYVPSRTKL